MESRSINEYIFFGTVLRYLQDVQEGWRVHGHGLILYNIDKLFDSLEQFNLPVTKRAAYKIEEYRDELATHDSDYRLSREEANKLREIISDLRNTLEAEAKGNIAFIVTDKRLDSNKLLKNVRELVAPNIFDSFPDIAQYDLIESGKCIAFERPTAAAFHLLRGTESVLRDYYCSIVKRNRVNNLLWGPIVEHLRRRRNPPPTALLDNLDNIRRSFRNPTQHPDKIYDIQEVQDLFGLCIDVINRMGKFLKNKQR